MGRKRRLVGSSPTREERRIRREARNLTIDYLNGKISPSEFDEKSEKLRLRSAELFSKRLNRQHGW